MPKKLVPIVELSDLLGVTVRRLEEDCREGLPVARTGKRGVRLFDVEVAKAWRRTNRRQVFGEGRSRGSSKSDLSARIRRLATVPASSAGLNPASPAGLPDPGPPEDGLPQRAPVADLGELDPSRILAMVVEGTIDQAHARAYVSAIAAMERGLEYRLRVGSVVEVGPLSAAIGQVLQSAHAVLDAQVDAIVAAVSEAVTLTEAQRHAVRAAASRSIDAIARALSDLSSVAPKGNAT